jgi:hypothetical protein
MYWILKLSSIIHFIPISPSAAFRSICIHLTRFLVTMGGIYQHSPSDCGVNMASMMAWSTLTERYDSEGVDSCKQSIYSAITGVLFEILAF